MVKMSIVLLLVTFGLAYGNEDFRILDSITQEEDCSRTGGMCTIAADCPELTNETGLCPKQQGMGVECCYGLSNKETRCRKRGGECTLVSERSCPENLMFKTASDCKSGEVCCIYTI